MIPGTRETFAKAFMVWFKGNELAVRACLDLVEIAHLWDDLVDADQPFSDPDAVMRKAMFELPMNPFWLTNQSMLLPVLQSVYLQWKAANVLDQTDSNEDFEKAYMLRASLYQLFHFVAAICGGVDWAVSVGPEIYRFYGEKLDDLKGAKNA